MAIKFLGTKPGAHCPRCGKWNGLNETYATYSGGVRCRSCGCFFSVEFKFGYLQSQPRILPPSDVELPSPPLPGKIRQDLVEAGICFSAGAPRATVVLCRRALETAAQEMGATGRTLADKLEELFRKSLIPESLYHASSEIRVFGNYGAHPADDLLKDVDDEVAREVLYFARETLDDIYVKPARLKELQKRRTGTSLE